MNYCFAGAADFTKTQLTVIQRWLQLLNASSHMCVTLEKGVSTIEL